jgi:cell division protein FtsW
MSSLKKFIYSKLILLVATALSLVGLVFVFEASVAEAFQDFHDPYHFVRHQAMWLILGLLMMLICSYIPYKFWQKMGPLLYVIAILLLIATVIPGLGKAVNGASRWLVIAGVTLQPVEVLKISMIMFFANWMSKHQKIAPFLLLTVLPTALLMMQPDLGSALIVLAIAFGIYFLAGGRLVHLSILGLAGIMGIAMLILIQPYRMRRITTFLNPELDPLGSSFHIRQITLAIGSGGWLGQGIGKSRQKYSYIPETSTDSIFAIVAEEIGFVGSTVLVLAFLWYLKLGYSLLVIEKPMSYPYLLKGGILMWISTQIVLNLGSVVALVPLTGVPLPFFSYGGSSLVMILCATGILSQTSQPR